MPYIKLPRFVDPRLLSHTWKMVTWWRIRWWNKINSGGRSYIMLPYSLFVGEICGHNFLKCTSEYSTEPVSKRLILMHPLFNSIISHFNLASEIQELCIQTMSEVCGLKSSACHVTSHDGWSWSYSSPPFRVIYHRISLPRQQPRDVLCEGVQQTATFTWTRDGELRAARNIWKFMKLIGNQLTPDVHWNLDHGASLFEKCLFWNEWVSLLVVNRPR